MIVDDSDAFLLQRFQRLLYSLYACMYKRAPLARSRLSRSNLRIDDVLFPQSTFAAHCQAWRRLPRSKNSWFTCYLNAEGLVFLTILQSLGEVRSRNVKTYLKHMQTVTMLLLTGTLHVVPAAAKIWTV
jgi:hypothetical protein